MAVALQQESLENENKIKWTDRSADEQREMIKANLAYQLNRAVINGTSVLFERHSKESLQDEKNIAYSGFSGNAYSGVNALLLDNMRNERGYKRNVWLNANEAMRMGANLGKGLEKLKGLPYVEIHTIQTESTRAMRDDKGEIMRDSQGKAILETKKMDRPQLNTHRVYNIEDIARIGGFKMGMIKPLNKENVNKFGGVRFMSSAHNEKGEIDPEKAIVLEELKNINYKGKTKDGKEINYSLKDEVIKAVKRYYFAINFPNNDKNKGYDFPLDKRFATRVNDRLDKVLESKQQTRDNELKQPSLEKQAEVANTTIKPKAKIKAKTKSKSNDYGMSM